MYVHYVYAVHMETRRGHQRELELQEVESSRGELEQNPGPLQGLQVLLTTEPSFQPFPPYYF